MRVVVGGLARGDLVAVILRPQLELPHGRVEREPEGGELVAHRDRHGRRDGALDEKLQAQALSAVAERVGSAPLPVALAWLLQRSPNILLIPGTSSVEHLRENIAGAAAVLSEDDVRELDAIGTRP